MDEVVRFVRIVRNKIFYPINTYTTTTMIKDIIDLLQTDQFKEGSEIVQIAKGINSIPRTPIEAIKQAKQTLRLKNK